MKYEKPTYQELTEKVAELEVELSKMQWLHKNENGVEPLPYNPEYGDLAELNTERTILDNIGKDTLKILTSDLMDLLDTSVVIYEKNGDYAYAVFNSGWCQFLDASSRKLCNTVDNKAALNSGKWLCHEDCWKKSAKPAIENQKCTDINCIGDIKIYAEPIFVQNEVIGAINIGYGNPPTDTKRLKELSEKYNIDFDTLKQKATAYNSRPDFIIDIAKKRLKSVATLIGEYIRREKAEQALKQSEEKLSSIYRVAPTGIGVVVNRVLKDINPYICDMTGYSREELIDKNAQILYPSREEYEFVGKEKYEQILKNGTGIVETHWKKKDGIIIRVLLASTPIDANNHSKGVTFTALDISESKKAEQALIESEERFRYLFRDIPTVAVQGYQFDGTTTYWNKASEDLYGYSAEEAIGHNLLDLIIPSEIKEKVRIEIRQMFESLNPAPSAEMSLMRKDGKRVTVISSHSIVQRTGNTPELFCLDIDISQRKQAEKQLEESEHNLLVKNEELIKAKEKAEENGAKLKLLNRLTSEMLLLPDLESSYKFIADRLQKYYPDTIVLYVSINESSKKTKLEVISGLNNRLLKNVINILGVNPVGKTYELKELHNNFFRSGNLVEFKDGLAGFSASEFPTFAANAIEKLIGLHKIYTIGVNKDDELLAAIHFFTFNKQTITDGSFIEIFVKQAGLVLQRIFNEKALILAIGKAEQSKKRFKSLIENAPDAVVINDKEGRLIYVSPNAYRHFGYSEGELIGQIGSDFTHPEDLPVVFEAFDTITRNPAKKPKVQYRFRKSNGEYRWIETTFANLLDNETIKGFVLNFSDITEKKQALEDLVIAKEKAEEADRLKSAFLANMSHEIRTPMNGILGFTGLLLEPDLSSKEKENYINVIHKSGQRMLNTVNDIVEISKIEAGLVNVVEKNTDLNEKLEELTRFFQFEAEKKGLKLILEMLLPTKKKNVLTDQNKLESILSNLIKNAIKYTESGTINLGCRQKGMEIEFYIKDTGMGIPPHRRAAIFNRFEQADIEDKQVHEGSGLGLAISKSYVEMLGGKIWLESEVGKGSTFYFTLPAKSNLVEKSNAEKQISFQGEKVKSQIIGLKILIAEDDETSMNYVSLIVKDFNAELLKAKTGNEAIEHCRNNKDIDLVLMDIKMPELDGHEATRRIREFNKDVIIIAQTAYGLTGDREKAIESGCNDYISKPIDKEKLSGMINKHLIDK